MIEKRRQTEFDRVISQNRTTPEETILANWQETFFRLCKSGFHYSEATEAMVAFSDPDGGPEEAL